MHIHHIKR